MKTASFFFCLLVLAAGVSAETIRVPDQYETIQAAIDAAEAGDEVLVAAGTYNDCTHEKEMVLHCVIMKSGVSLIGSGSSSTIIDAQGLGRVMLADSCAAGTRIEGITVTGGSTSNPRYGAGLHCYYSEIEFQDVTMTENVTSGNGGGASVVRGANIFTDCVFSNNQANAYYGGGIYCISSNSEFISCHFTRNNARSGGGIVCDFSSGHPVFRYCLIDHNSASNGGGIWTSNSTRARFEFCTITENSGTSGSSFHSLTSWPSLYCCILAFGEGPAIHCPEGVEFECCDVYGHTGGDEIQGTDLGGCFSLDPEFIDRYSGNYYLQPSSPCQPSNHPGGCNDVVIGAFPPDNTPIQKCSWGSIKAAFR